MLKAHALGRSLGITNIGGYANRNTAPGKPSDHAKWRAYDFMVGTDRARGDRLVSEVIGRWYELGVKYVIWDGKIMTYPGVARPYTHPRVRLGERTNPTLEHRDHVHISFH